MCVYMYLYIYIHTYVYIYIHIHYFGSITPAVILLEVVCSNPLIFSLKALCPEDCRRPVAVGLSVQTFTEGKACCFSHEDYTMGVSWE